MAEKNKDRDIESGDLPQEITESYGTGVKDLVSDRSFREKTHEYTETSPELTGGDIDAYWQDADAVGDEAVGGTAPTPDQNVTEEIEAAVGLEMGDNEMLHTNDILEGRDRTRWELDPTSSDDYQDRQR